MFPGSPSVLSGTLLGALLAAGCSSVRAPGNLREAEGPERRLLTVPFFADDTDQCGPSALAAVLAYWGDPAGPAALKKEVYLTSLKGSLAMDLLLAAKRRGLSARLYRGSLEEIKSEVRLGHPVIAFLNRGYAAFPIGHFVVVTGFDEEREGLHIHSALTKDQFVRYGTFMKSWEKTQRSALLVLPPERAKEPSHAGP